MTKRLHIFIQYLRKKKALCIVACILIQSLNLEAQNFADKKYYLIDSLDLINVANSDRTMLDSCLQIYHGSNSDTVKLKAIEYIAENSWDDNIWPRYNEWTNTFASSKLQELQSSDTKDKHLEHLYLVSLAGSTNNQGINYVSNGNIELGLLSYQKSLDFYQQIGDTQGMSITLNNIGTISEQQGDIAKSMDYYQRSLKLERQLGNKQGEAAGLNNLAIVYLNLGDISRALDYHHTSLKIREDLGDKQGMAESFNNIAYIYDDQGDTEKAIDHYEKSMKIKKEIGDDKGLAASLNNLGVIYERLGEVEKGIEYYERGLKLYQETNYMRGVSINLNNLATVYYDQDDLEKSLDYSLRSLKISQEIDYKKGLVQNLSGIGLVYYSQGDYEKAIDNTKKALELGEELGFPVEIRNAAKTLHAIYQSQKEDMKAFEMFQLYALMQDSIRNNETEKAMLQQQARYEYEKQKELDDKEHDRLLAKEKEATARLLLNVEKKENQIATRNYIIGIVLIIVVAFWFYVARQRTMNVYKINVLQQQLLKAQIRPNFIFNVMNSIKSLIATRDMDGATNYLGDFSSLMRKNLEAFSEKHITLLEEIELTRLYLKLEKLRLKDTLIYEIDIEDEVNVDSFFVPPMLLQPLVENAIIHGIMPTNKSGLVQLQIRKQNSNEIEVIVRDNGVGYKGHKKRNEIDSIGLRLTEQRITLWNPKNKISTKNLEGADTSGTEIKIKIQL